MRGSPSRVWLRIALVALALGAWLVVDVSSASAATITCGQTITQDTTVDNDLSNCPGDGLVVGADNITLDLNGHTVTGTGATNSDGVRFDGYSAVTVKNGTVKTFAVGIGLLQTNKGPPKGDRVLVIDATQNQQQIIAGGASESVLAGNRGNISVTGDTGDAIAWNTSSGIFLEGSVSEDVVANRLGGISVFAGRDHHIEQNEITGGSVGLGSGAGNVLIANNTLRQGRITLAQAYSNVVLRNTISGSPGNGITLNGDPVENAAADSNVLWGNRIVGAHEDGILIQGPHPNTPPIEPFPGATNTLVRHNTVRRSGNDGIHTNAPTTTLTKNIANFNTDVGINAPAGAIDGGGNHAHGNGSVQCINIACSP